jgi:hypothetical protein
MPFKEQSKRLHCHRSENIYQVSHELNIIAYKSQNTQLLQLNEIQEKVAEDGLSTPPSTETIQPSSDQAR